MPAGDRAQPDPRPRASGRGTSRRSAPPRPAARLVTIGFEGLADGPLDDVEVLLRGWLAAEPFDRLLARAPHLRWVHSATAGVERALTPAPRARDVLITNARGVFSRPIAEYVMLMILAVTAGCRSCSSSSASGRGSRSRRASCAT